MVLKPAVKYQKVATGETRERGNTPPVPRDNH